MLQIWRGFRHAPLFLCTWHSLRCDYAPRPIWRYSVGQSRLFLLGKREMEEEEKEWQVLRLATKAPRAPWINQPTQQPKLGWIDRACFCAPPLMGVLFFKPANQEPRNSTLHGPGQGPIVQHLEGLTERAITTRQPCFQPTRSSPIRAHDPPPHDPEAGSGDLRTPRARNPRWTSVTRRQGLEGVVQQRHPPWCCPMQRNPLEPHPRSYRAPWIYHAR